MAANIREAIEEVGGQEVAEEMTKWLWEVGREARSASPRWCFLAGPWDDLEIVAETCWPPSHIGLEDLDTEYGALRRWVGRSTCLDLIGSEEVAEWEARSDRLWLTGNRWDGTVDPPVEHSELCYVYLVTTRRDLAELVINVAFPHLPPVPSDTPLIRTLEETVQDIQRRRAVQSWEQRTDPVQTPLVNESGERIGSAMGSEAQAVSKLRWSTGEQA